MTLDTLDIILLLFGGGILAALAKLLYSTGRFTHKVDTMSDTLVEVDGDVAETKGAVIEMQDTFHRLGYPMQRILQATSPVVLTDYGMELLGRSGFNDVFSENRDTILGWVKSLNPKNSYDAQEYSREALLAHKDDPIFTPMKDYAYENGEASFEQVLRAGSIVVRDEIIKDLGLDKS